MENGTFRQTTSGANAGGRIPAFDLLRIIACFSVVMLHVSSQFWYEYPVTDPNWIVANSYDAVFRFGVPVFVMISGAIFLNPDRPVKTRRLLLHNALRMLILYLVWSCLYGLWDLSQFDASLLTFSDYYREMTSGRYHLWFLTMIAGLYVLTPVLRSWIRSAQKSDVEYFLILCGVFMVLRNTLAAFSEGGVIDYVCSLFRIAPLDNYLGYFVLGYYLLRYGISEKRKKALYALAAAGVFANMILGTLLSWRIGRPAAEIYDSFGIFTFLIATALYVFFAEKTGRADASGGAWRWITALSGDTLGIYLVHLFLIEFLEKKGIHSMMFLPILNIPCLAVAVFVIGAVIAAILRRIPFVGRYLC